ncbi:USP [Symbiodinium natans]|uniref:USP protein n=1 Tax=Symbiodinium natans TaxID=878477 RepID=A0A812RV86_9DINO|nr:USP [Symbiodinium natans]
MTSTKSLSLEQLRRRFDRLRALQQRLTRPVPKHFTACGRRYDLPLRSKTGPSFTTVPPHMLDYLAGFFDGDGSVIEENGILRLKVSQAESSSQVLLLFRNVLGGGIYAEGNTVGMRQVVLRWCLLGERACHAAELLRQSSSCKYDQLLLVRSQLQRRAELKSLKAVAPSKAVCPSWSYLAGFFDAEGHIKIVYPASIVLQIEQKFPQILHAIRDFFLDAGITCVIYNRRVHYALVINRTSESKRILSRLLMEGLRAKRLQARICLDLGSIKFHDIRVMLTKRVGYQSRYVRLTSAGAERAYEIKKLRSRLWKSQANSPSQLAQLKQLQEDHLLKCAEERNQLLRADIRSQLQQ